MIKKYSDQEYTNAYLSLNDEQRDVLNNFIKAGYKTKWLYILAMKKGLIKSEEELVSMSETDIDILLNNLEWDLIDYVDYLRVNPNVKCECGRALRHAYAVKHNPTGKVYVLGRDHFQQHTMLNPNDVKDIFSNFKLIDLEKIELLNKVIENKDYDIDKKINKNFEIPKDIVMQIKVKLPLLDRQIKRLKNNGAFSDYYENIRKNAEFERNKKQQSFGEDKTNLFQESIVKHNHNDINTKVINFEEMMYKLETNTWTVEEAAIYQRYFIYNSSKINRMQFDRKRMRKALYCTCSKLPPNSKFKSLIVDIGYLIFPDF